MSGSKFYKNESNQTCKKHHGKLIAVLFAVICFGAAFSFANVSPVLGIVIGSVFAFLIACIFEYISEV
ncbi:MAG: hypothetical protein UHY90_01400 [Treponema sp.]|nr:hypothetical protein [Treponema sp.]